MATVKHTKVSAVPDGDDATQVQPSDWNADHEITLSGSGLVGKSTVGSGSAQEISLGSGLVFNASSVDVQAKTINGESILGTGNIELATVAQVDLKVDKVAGQSLMLDAERTKLGGIAAGAQVNVATNLAQGTRTATGIPLTSSTGTGTTLPVATTTLAGLQSAADKAKLDGISAGAQVNSVTSVAGKTGAVSLVKADVGLSNVDNTSDLNKPVSTAQQAALNLKANLASPALTGTPTAPTQDAVDNSTKIATTEFVKTAIGDINSGVISVSGDAPVTITGTASNPVIGVSNATTSTSGAMSAADKSKLNGIAAGAQVNVGTNLSQGTRTSTAVPVASSTGSAATLAAATATLAGVMSAADKAKLDGIATGAQVNTVTSVAGKTGAISLVKADVGLSNVDNTSDLSKPVSTATQTALNAKLNASAVGSTVASLVGGKVPLSQINDSIIGQVEYMGVWNAATNSPTLPATPTEKGHYYVTSVAGTFQSILYAVGDWIISNGVSWDKVDNTDAVSSVAGKTGVVTLTKNDVGLASVDNTSDLNKPVSTATQTALNNKLGVTATAAAAQKLATARTINGVAFDGSANIVTGADWANVTNKPDTYAPSAHTHAISEVTGLQGALDGKLGSTATAVAATKLATARTIGGVSFDGTASINLPGVNTAGNQSTTGNAATATKLSTARTINGVSFDGTASITVADSTKEPAFAAGTTAQYRRGDKTWQDFATAVRASVMTGLSTVTATAVLATDTLLAAVGKLQAQVTGLSTSKLDTTANAVSASKLATSRTVALTGDVTGSATFDGSANITITATVQDDSHNHVIGNVDGLLAALDGKVDKVSGKGLSTNDLTAALLTKLNASAPLASPALTGNPTAPTPAADDSDTSIATTAHVKAAMGLFGVGISNTALVTDCNAATTSGMYTVSGQAANRPPVAGSANASVLVMPGGTSARCTQLFAYDSTATPYMAIRHLSSSGWGDWQELFHTANILGTVSQSGGVSTGAIIERGSNGNGRYVRFADGTQICTSPVIEVPEASAAIGNMHATEAVTWNYPAVFVFNSEIVTGTTGLTRCWVSSNSSLDSGNSTSFRIFGPYGWTGATVLLTAIGRWY